MTESDKKNSDAPREKLRISLDLLSTNKHRDNGLINIEKGKS